MHLLGNYEDFVRAFLEKGYEFICFRSLSKQYDEIIMRHDVDFDCHLARQMADLESRLGIKATYFFMLGGDCYNALASENADMIRAVRDQGHTISLHFDPTIYADFEDGFEREKEIFEKLFDVTVDTVSIHRPNRFFQTEDKPIRGIEHAYQSKFFEDISFFSDSRGKFRYGHPLESVEFADRRTMHLLIHPVWWMIKGESNIDVLNSLMHAKHEEMQDALGKNCTPYRRFLEGQG